MCVRACVCVCVCVERIGRKSKNNRESDRLIKRPAKYFEQKTWTQKPTEMLRYCQRRDQKKSVRKKTPVLSFFLISTETPTFTYLLKDRRTCICECVCVRDGVFFLVLFCFVSFCLMLFFNLKKKLLKKNFFFALVLKTFF